VLIKEIDQIFHIVPLKNTIWELFFPHLDDLISSLNYGFMTQKEAIISLQYILPFVFF